MNESRYAWRSLSPEERREVISWRRNNRRPWHAPPHLPNLGRRLFHVTAACYEHLPHIGLSPKRMDEFCGALVHVLRQHATSIAAWCVLPNHYHLLAEVDEVADLIQALGRLHGRTSHAWNGEEGQRGRKVFHRAADRYMRSDRHVFATMNYIHHNPVHHGYVRQWTDWPWSSAMEYLDEVGRDEAARIWREHPIRDYGKGWDDAGV